MDRRKGAETFMGLRGVSKESRDSYDTAERLFNEGKEEKAWPYMRKALEDPNNLDARIGLAIIMSGDPKVSVKILKSAEAKGRENLIKLFGPKCFDDDGEQVGDFWGLVDTRPYMRVLKSLAEIHNADKQYKEAAELMIEMLRLCPEDNMGNRTWLGTLLVRLGRYADALYFVQVRLEDQGDVELLKPCKGGTLFKPPARNFVPEEGEDCSLLHTAAIASFKLWGDCADSRRYLKIAAKSNPLVLLKVLGKIRQPGKPNTDGRSFNGPEDAHDYLYLTQDLWMKSDVWNWANNNPDVKKFILKKCSRKECQNVEVLVAEFKRCSACHLVYYCNTNCQNRDWKNHKPECKKYKEYKRITKTFHGGKGLPVHNIPMFTTDFTKI
ncbi:hypothetical protein BDQ17DRAFT_1302547 [Cyathus striatus]|nr:hypothetical protein BDQ17DRAFT_1302547 [Cyathus striatus]